jgi:hypothetical protein
MSEKEVTDWLVGIGTIVLAVVAIFQDHIRGFIYRPKLSTSMKTAPPDCMAVPASIQKPGNISGFSNSVSVDAMYLRMLVENTGIATALNVEVYAHALNREKTDGTWETIHEFPPMNLVWADVGGMYFPRIGRNMSKHCDVAAIFDPAALAAVIGGPIKDGLDATETSLSFLLVTRPNHKGNVVGPGEYRLDVLVAAENARPIERSVYIKLPGIWHTDQTAMLRNGVGVSVEPTP